VRKNLALAYPYSKSLKSGHTNYLTLKSLVLAWDFYGNYSRHISPFEWNLQYPNIILATQILIPALGVVSVVAGVRWLRGLDLKLDTRKG
jgi:hypothetical protein